MKLIPLKIIVVSGYYTKRYDFVQDRISIFLRKNSMGFPEKSPKSASSFSAVLAAERMIQYTILE